MKRCFSIPGSVQKTLINITIRGWHWIDCVLDNVWNFDVKKYLIEIATGNRPAQPYDLFPFSEEVPTEIFGRLEHLYKIIRLWHHTMHDNTQCENLTIGDPRAQRWRKEYFIYWGTKNGYKMEWLPEISSAGYMPEYRSQFANNEQAQTNIASEPNWHVIPSSRNNRDGATQIQRCLEMMRVEKDVEH